MIYFIVLILLLFLSFRYDINGKTEGREQCYLAMLIIFILIAGLRWRLGADTTSYIRTFYHLTPLLKDYELDEMTLGMNPLWVLLNSVVKTLGGRFYVVQLIEAFVVNFLIFKYFKKHTQYIFTCVFFYFIWRYFNMNMQEMKASISVVLCLYGNDYILEKKWVKGYILYLIGCLFHFSTLLILLTPLFFFLRFNRKGLVLIAIAFIFGYMVQSSFDDYLMLFEFDDRIGDKAEGYLERANEKENSLLVLLVYTLPPPIYAFLCALYLKKMKLDYYLLRFECFVVIGVICYLISINISIFYRYAHFYTTYLILFYSSCFVDLFKKKLRNTFSVATLSLAILFSPLCMSFAFYFIKGDKYVMYYPYNSIFNRKVNKEREVRFNVKLNRPAPNYNEY